MKWFGRKAAVQPRPFLLRGWSALAGGEPWPRNYEAQVREAYLGNPVAQRAVRLVAESVASAVVYDAGEEKGGPSTRSGRAVSLMVPSLIEALASQLLLHGNAFVQILLDAEGEPGELFALRPERVSVEADSSGWPAAYLYKAGEAKTRIAARDGLGRPGVVHLKAHHPLDDHYGLGCLGAAAGAVALHNAATSFHNEALVRIDAVMAAAVEEGPLQAPPSAPAEGQCWIVAAEAGDAWSGKTHSLAIWTGGGWRFVFPPVGMQAWKKSSGLWIHWDGTSWSDGAVPAAALVIGGKKVVGERLPQLPSPSGGTIIDAQARAAVQAILVALKTHGLTE